MSARRLALRYGILLCASLLSLSAAFAAPALAAGPSVDSQYVTGVHTDAATLNAQVNPSGADTTYRFEYGTSASYGSSVPVSGADAGSGSEDVTVQQGIEGLQPGTVYHYRLLATNEGGTSEGADRTFMTYAVQVPGPETCPNANIRAAQSSSYLPDCRAYELVSPVDSEKEGANIAADASRTQSATDGNAVKYYSKTAFGDALGTEVPGAEYIASRGAEGWASHSINPIQASLPFSLLTTPVYQAVSPDLSKGVFFAMTPALPGHPNVQHVPNLYLRNDLLTPGAGEYDLLSDANAPVPARSGFAGDSTREISFAGASADWNHILFESSHNLTPETEGLSTEAAKAYEWDAGTVRLAGVLPDGTPAQVSIPGDGVNGHSAEGYPGSPGWSTNSISADGSRIVFTAGPLIPLHGTYQDSEPAGGTVYMRIDHTETVQVNQSERTDCNIERKAEEPSYVCKGTAEPDPNGPQQALFVGASKDDSKVFFITQEALTDNAETGVLSVYMYEANRPAGHRLTLVSVDGEPADVVHVSDEVLGIKTMVVGLSEDGSYVYFTSPDNLLPGLPPLSENTEAPRRLYMWHDGVVHYVANAKDIQAAFDGRAWGNRGQGDGNTFRVSSDGKTATFMSSDPTTAQRVGYDSSSPGGHCGGVASFGGPPHCFEVYVYKADQNELLCASCNKTGAVAESDASFVESQDDYFTLQTTYLNHPMSDDGRYVFFDTREALLPDDTNGEIDVYEYDTQTKTQYLISSGTCDCNSVFSDASPDGSNAFFTTRQALVRRDVGTSSDLYDVRIEGGIPAQNQAPPSPCAGEDCQGPIASAPAFSLPSSLTFAGQGNAQAPAPVVSTKKVKPKKVKHKKAKHKKAKPRKHHKKRKKSGKRASLRVGR